MDCIPGLLTAKMLNQILSVLLELKIEYGTKTLL